MVRMKRGWLIAAGALALAACSSQGDDATAEGDAGDEPQALTPVDTAPQIEAPALAPLSQAEIEAELEAGGGCSVEQDGKALLVAVDGDAIARPYGTMRHFSFGRAGEGEEYEAPSGSQLDALYDGGVFRAGAITVTVVPEEGDGEQIGEVLVKTALVTISEENEGTGEIRAEWHCGA